MASVALHTWKLFFIYSSLESADAWLLSTVREKWLTIIVLCPFLFHCLNLRAIGESDCPELCFIWENDLHMSDLSAVWAVNKRTWKEEKEVTLKFLGDCCYSHQITWIAFLSVRFFLHYSCIVSVSPQFTRGEYKQSAHFFILWYSLSLSLPNLFLENHFLLTWIERIHI